jgi:polyisoprenoid-binding protein YceI
MKGKNEMTATVQERERASVGTGTWTIDPTHSTAEFAVKHMMVSTVKGRFKNLSGSVQLDEADPTRSVVEAAIEVASVDTGAEQRDEHLRSDDFFNAARYPRITFRSTRIEQAENAPNWRMTGDLTIRDITRSVELDVEPDGRGLDAFGKERAGFTATGRISRKEFGVKWNQVIETGGVAVGDTVKITLNIEVVRQK